jgi:hypothetical protein
MMMILFGLAPPCPELKKPTFMIFCMAKSKSASSKTIMASFELNCKDETFKYFPARAAMTLPDSVEPVKLTPAI